MKSKLLNTVLSAAVMIGAYAVLNILGAHDAFAQTGKTLGDTVTNLQNSIKDGSQLVYTGAYIGGTTALLMGASKLKAHADNPGQTPMQQGLVRIAAGAGLIAIPGVADMTLNTLGVNKNATVAGSTSKIKLTN